MTLSMQPSVCILYIQKFNSFKFDSYWSNTTPTSYEAQTKLTDFFKGGS